MTSLGYATSTGAWFDTLSATIIRSRRPRLPAATPPAAAGYEESVPQLQLSLTYACNMHCSYCSFRSRMNEDGRPLNMANATALEAVDFFLRDVVAGARHARIDFGLTGETFLRHKLHAALQAEIRARALGSPLRSLTAGPNTTNGTLSQEIGVEAAMGPPQDISCDGPRDVHDASRPFVGGAGSYDTLAPMIKEVLGRHPDIGVTAVITSRCLDIVRIFRHLYDDLGFRSLYLKPVNLRPEDPNGLNAQTVGGFRRGYSELVEFFIASGPDGMLRYLSALNEEDYFMRFFNRVVNRTRNVYRCGAGKSGAYVDTDGKLFACAHFIGKTGYEIGDIHNGFDENKRDEYRALTVDSREPCRSCWAKYACGGGCYYQAVLANGDIRQPDKAKCELIVHLLAEAIRLYEHLADTHPDVLAALPIAIHLPTTAAAASAADTYTPVSTLRADPEKGARLDLLTSQHLIGSRPVEGDRLALRMELREGQVRLRFDEQSSVRLEGVELWMIDCDREPVTMADLPVFSVDLFGRRLRWDASGGFSLTEPRRGGPFRAVPYAEPEWRPVGPQEGARLQGAWSASFDFARLLGLEGSVLGFNLSCRLSDGRQSRLVRAEPYATLDLRQEGRMRLLTPIWRRPADREAINASPYEGMISLVEWRGRQQNVC